MKAHIYKEPAVVLVWGYPQTEPGYESLRAICRRCKARLRLVLPEETGETVAALAGLEPLRHAPAKEVNAQPAILFSGMDGRVEAAVDALRAAGVQIPLKALATPTNRGWNFAALLEELTKEHAAMTAGQEGQT